MHTNARKLMVELAKGEAGPFCMIANRALEEEIIVPSILRTELEDEGFIVSYRDGPGGLEDSKEGEGKHGAWVLVLDENNVVIARAFSHSEGNALLQAIFAEMKSESNKPVASEASSSEA